MLSSSGDATGFERLLLDAVRREQPSASLRRRMQQGLGIATSIFGLKAALAAASQIAVVALLASGISDSPKSILQAPRASEHAAVSAPVEVTPPQAAAAAVVAPAPAPELDVTAVKPAAKATIARAETPRAVPALRDEIRLLDRARSALQQKAPKRALLELARYQERFPRGSFRQEASVLRVEALAQGGERDRAAALARDFVAQHPNSPHVDRVEQVTNTPRGGRRTSGALPR